MSRIFLLFVGTGLGNALSGAVPATSPTSTSHTRTDDPAAATTPAVQGLPQLQSAFSESPQLCGYLGGDSCEYTYAMEGRSTVLKMRREPVHVPGHVDVSLELASLACGLWRDHFG